MTAETDRSGGTNLPPPPASVHQWSSNEAYQAGDWSVPVR